VFFSHEAGGGKGDTGEGGAGRRGVMPPIDLIGSDKSRIK